MKEKLIALLGLKPLKEAKKVTADQIIDAVTVLIKSDATAERETKIASLVAKTGMQRTDAEHVIDQQDFENQTRAKRPAAQNQTSPAWTSRQLNPHGL